MHPHTVGRAYRQRGGYKMKAIVYGADADPQKWEASRCAYESMLADGYKDCAYTFRSGVEVYAQRGKHSITITVQPDDEASK